MRIRTFDLCDSDEFGMDEYNSFDTTEHLLGTHRLQFGKYMKTEDVVKAMQHRMTVPPDMLVELQKGRNIDLSWILEAFSAWVQECLDCGGILDSDESNVTCIDLKDSDWIAPNPSQLVKELYLNGDWSIPKEEES